MNGGAAKPRAGGRGGPDGRAPPVSVCREKEKEAGELGRRRGELGRVGRYAHERGRGRPAARGGFAGCGKKKGSWAGWAKRGKGRGEKGFSLFLKLFQIHFQTFKTSIKQETMHSNHDAQTLIISNFIILKVNLLDNLIMSLRKN
jgi:hypothetical protein